MPKTYPDIGTFSSGQILTASTMNDVATNLDNQRSRPMVRCVLNADVSSYTATDIAWNGTDTYDTDAMHDTVTNNSRITFQTAGIYQVTFQIYMTHSGTATVVECGIKDQSSNIIGQYYVGGSSASGNIVIGCQAVLDSSTVTYVTAYANLPGATGVTVKADSQRRTFLSAFWLGATS